MGLAWVRLDGNIASHDKIVALLGERDGAKAFTLYVCALAWSGAHGTDGVVPRTALPFIHGNVRLADQLVAHRLWEPSANGSWTIRNYTIRQELDLITEMKRENKRIAGRKSQCVQRHGPDCGCWKDDQ